MKNSAAEIQLNVRIRPILDATKCNGDKSVVDVDTAGKVVVKVNPKYYRPSEVDTLLGDCSKAKNALGWSPKITFDDLVYDMCKNES